MSETVRDIAGIRELSRLLAEKEYHQQHRRDPMPEPGSEEFLSFTRRGLPADPEQRYRRAKTLWRQAIVRYCLRNEVDHVFVPGPDGRDHGRWMRSYAVEYPNVLEEMASSGEITVERIPVPFTAAECERAVSASLHLNWDVPRLCKAMRVTPKQWQAMLDGNAEYQPESNAKP